LSFRIGPGKSTGYARISLLVVALEQADISDDGPSSAVVDEE